MFVRLLHVLIFFCLLFPISVTAAEIRLHGSTTVLSNIVEPYKAEIESQSGHTLKIVPNGSSQGTKDVASGIAHIAMISAPLRSVVTKINEKEPGAIDYDKLISYQIGETRVAFTTHKNNPVQKLTLAQISNILDGTIKNWREVGGQDSPILIITEMRGGGLRSMVEDALLNKASISASKNELINATDIPKAVSETPNSLGIMSSILVDDSLFEIKTDKPIAQPLILVTSGNISAEVQSVIDAAKSVGAL